MAAVDKARIQISLTREQVDELNKACSELGITKSTAIAFALRSWLKKVDEDRATARS